MVFIAREKLGDTQAVLYHVTTENLWEHFDKEDDHQHAIQQVHKHRCAERMSAMHFRMHSTYKTSGANYQRGRDLEENLKVIYSWPMKKVTNFIFL